MNLQARIATEKRIVKAVIDTLLSQGCTISVYDGEAYALKRSDDRKAILAACFSTDVDTFVVRQAGERLGFVSFVYGNDGWDVMADYAISLEEMLSPVRVLIDKLAA